MLFLVFYLMSGSSLGLPPTDTLPVVLFLSPPWEELPLLLLLHRILMILIIAILINIIMIAIVTVNVVITGIAIIIMKTFFFLHGCFH